MTNRAERIRFHDPLTRHELLRAIRYEFKPNKQLDEESRQAVDRYRAPAAERRRVRAGHGPWGVILELADVLEREGLIQNDIEPETDRIVTFENNTGLLFRGSAPSIAMGGATVVGTGGSLSLTLADATDNAGRIVLVTGNAPAPSAVGAIGTITFVRPKANANYGVIVNAADADAADRPAYSDFGGRTTTGFTFANRTTLAGNTSYHWEWTIVERQSL